MAVKWYGKQVMADIEKLVEARLDVCAQMIADDAKLRMKEPKSGVPAPTGKRKRRGFVTRRSAPGEAPAVQTGRLVRSVTVQKQRMVRRIGTNLKYGAYLELGTRHMAARPYLRPAMDKLRGKVESLFRSARPAA